jgi:hypothetical protein
MMSLWSGSGSDPLTDLLMGVPLLPVAGTSQAPGGFSRALFPVDIVEREHDYAVIMGTPGSLLAAQSCSTASQLQRLVASSHILLCCRRAWSDTQ